MSGITRISIFRNDSCDSEPAENYSITLLPNPGRIAFASGSRRNPYEPFDYAFHDPELLKRFGHALSRWLGDGHPPCTYEKQFRNETVYRAWKQSVMFEDSDVSWHISFECSGGGIITFISLGRYPFPNELSTLIQEAGMCWFEKRRAERVRNSSEKIKGKTHDNP